MNNLKESLIKDIYKQTGIRVDTVYVDIDRIDFAKTQGTDSVTIVIDRHLGNLVEIKPSENSNETDIIVFEHSTLESCCEMFSAIMTYKEIVIDPTVNNMVSML